jgi:hypothetical protein
MKLIPKTSLTIVLSLLAMQFVTGQPKIKKTPPAEGQKTFDKQYLFNNTPLGNQLKQIFASAHSAYKNLRLGEGVIDHDDTLYTSSLNITGTKKSSIKSNRYSQSYIIVIAEDIKDPAATALFKKWSKDIVDALPADFNVKSDKKTEDGFLSEQDVFIDSKNRKVVLRNSSYNDSPSTIDILILSR